MLSRFNGKRVFDTVARRSTHASEMLQQNVDATKKKKNN